MAELATARLNLRTTPHAKAMIEHACDLMGVSASNFVIEQAYYKAVEVVENSQRIQLDPTEWQNALKLLDNPPKANDNMTALFTRGYRAINQ